MDSLNEEGGPVIITIPPVLQNIYTKNQFFYIEHRRKCQLCKKEGKQKAQRKVRDEGDEGEGRTRMIPRLIHLRSRCKHPHAKEAFINIYCVVVHHFLHGLRNDSKVFRHVRTLAQQLLQLALFEHTDLGGTHIDRYAFFCNVIL